MSQILDGGWRNYGGYKGFYLKGYGTVGGRGTGFTIAKMDIINSEIYERVEFGVSDRGTGNLYYDVQINGEIFSSELEDFEFEDF